MAQTGYTPIQLYRSSTPGATPTAGNLTDGELAINTADGKLFYKDSGGSVQVIAGAAAGSNTQIQYNNSGDLAGSANFTFDGSNVQIGAQGDLRFGDADNSNYVAFQAPATVASDVTWTLPNADGTSGQFLQTDGSGALTFATVSSPAAASGAIITNTTQISENYTFPSGVNGFSVGPITIDSGYSVTVASGQRWVVI